MSQCASVVGPVWKCGGESWACALDVDEHDPQWHKALDAGARAEWVVTDADPVRPLAGAPAP